MVFRFPILHVLYSILDCILPSIQSIQGIYRMMLTHLAPWAARLLCETGIEVP